jgi:hypothetical protein
MSLANNYFRYELYVLSGITEKKKKLTRWYAYQGIDLS